MDFRLSPRGKARDSSQASLSFLMMDFAKLSLISLCRGTG